MIPAVLIAQERDPFAVWRWPRLGSGFAPVRNAPGLFFGCVMDGVVFPVGGVHNKDRILLEVLCLSIEHEMRRIYPCQAAVLSGRADCHRLASGDFQSV